jgi:hypothetical protein
MVREVRLSNGLNKLVPIMLATIRSQSDAGIKECDVNELGKLYTNHSRAG